MENKSYLNSLILGFFIFAGLAIMGYLLSSGIIRFKEFERTVYVKGLAEREYPANIVLWPIQFVEAENDLTALYGKLEKSTAKIVDFLEKNGIDKSEISVSPPAIVDKSAQAYGGSERAEFRFTANQIVTVYSEKIETVRQAIRQLSGLGKAGIVLTGSDYRATTQYFFTKLNEIKPAMIEEATKNAREVAEKFASDSQSKLGKIKQAAQGQFSIDARDDNNPHIKKVRVVSTIEYYLSD